MKKQADDQLVRKGNAMLTAARNASTTSTTNATAAASPASSSRKKQPGFWKVISGLSSRKKNLSNGAAENTRLELETEFVAEVQPAVAVGKDMCSASIQEAFQLITAEARFYEPQSPHADDGWVVVDYEQTESTLLLKPARYIHRCLLPTFHRRDVRPIIHEKASDLLPARIDNQYLMDLKRTRVSKQAPNTTEQWCINGKALARDPFQNLVQIKRHTKNRSFQVTQLLNQRIGIDMTRKIQLYCMEMGLLTHFMPINIEGSRSLSVCTHANRLTITGRVSYRLVGLSDGFLDDEGNQDHVQRLHIQGIYDLCSGSVEYNIHTAGSSAVKRPDP